MSPRSRWIDAGLGLAVTVVLGSTPAAAQETLRPGAEVQGVLAADDPVDPEGVVFDVFVVPAEVSGRFAVVAESESFDVLLQWGVVDDQGEFEALGSVDDSPGLASTTDARVYLDHREAVPTALRVSSLDGGADGAYRIRMEEIAPARRTVGVVAIGERVSGSLTESDELSQNRFRDTHRFRGTAGDRILVGLTAEFDAVLALAPAGGAQGDFLIFDDDGFGSTDAFVETYLPADGEYEIVVTSWGQGLGEYTLDTWSAPPMDHRDILQGGRAADDGQDEGESSPGNLGEIVPFTEEELGALRIADDEVRNEPLGFRMPLPTSGFELDSSELRENLAEWSIRDPEEGSVVVLYTARFSVPAVEEHVTRAGFLAGVFLLSKIGFDAEWEEGASRDDWDGTRSLEQDFDITPPASWTGAEVRCVASGPDRAEGIVVCAVGLSDELGTFMEHFRELEFTAGTP